MKRTPLRRTGFKRRARKPMARGKRIRARRPTPRTRPEGYEDPGYLSYLREQPCRAPATATHWGPGHLSDPHHLRHLPSGASMGAHVKDDRRAISLCRRHHGDIEFGTGPWKGWTRDEIKAFENEQVAEQRATYLSKLALERSGEKFIF